MECLRQFQLLNLKGNTTGYSYYGTLEHMSDNPGLEKLPVGDIELSVFNVNSMNYSQNRLPSFMQMAREFCHIKMLKWGGRAFNPGGVRATAPGSLVIPCQACPMPNINLPRGWENVPPEKA
jgi:hypothetical protein